MIEELVGRLNAKKAAHKKLGQEIRALKKTITILEAEKGNPETATVSPEEKMEANLKAEGYTKNADAEKAQTERAPEAPDSKAKAAEKVKKLKAKVDLKGAEEIDLAGATVSYLKTDGSKWIPMPEDGYAELGPEWVIQVFYGSSIKMIDGVPALQILENRGGKLLVKAFRRLAGV